MPHLTLRRAWLNLSRSLLLVQCPFALEVHAQNEPDLRYLLFDPVPITIEADAEPGKDAYTARELRPPPQDETIDLQSWLAARYGTNARNQEQLDNDISRYNDLISTLESQQGPFAPSLPQHLLGLAATHAANGADDTALALYERALHIIRVNNGLYAPEQQQIVSRIIATHLARGDLLAANEEQEYLFHLQRRNAAQQRIESVLEPLRHQAAWNFFTFNAFTTPNPMYQNMPAFNLNRSFPRNSEELMLFRAQGLLRAQLLYQQMIDLVEANDGPDDPKLPPLQRELAVTCFYLLSRFDLSDNFAIYEGGVPAYALATTPMPPPCSRIGQQMLEDRIAILKQNRAAPLEQLQAGLDLADWLLYFDKRMEAMALIQTQRQNALAAGLAHDALAAWLDPPLPMTVPAFIPAAYSRQHYDIPANLNLEHKGYIDVRFVVTSFGAVRELEVLGRSTGTPEAVEDRLVRHLRSTQFRPRVTPDGTRKPDLASVRYYYTY